MSETPKKANWRIGTAFGVVITVSMLASKATEIALTPHVGEWVAFFASILAAGLAARFIVIIALIFLRK